MYDYILFDLDGTLTDPFQGITNSVGYALEKFGIIVTDKTDLKKFIGPPLVPAFMEFYGFSKEDAEKATAYYRETFSIKGLYENRVYDDTVDVLSKLKSMGKHVVLATSKPQKFADEILRHFNLTKYFDFVSGATFGPERAKKQDVIKYALDNIGNPEKSKVLMVGDREHDIIGANLNGIDSVGVLYGYGSYDELKKENASYIIERLNDLFEII